MSPFTPSLVSALQFRSWIRRVLAQKYRAVAGPDHIDIIKDMMEKRAAIEWKTRQSLETSLIDAVSAEIERREQTSVVQPPEVAPSHAAQLRIRDLDVAEQVMNLAQAALVAQTKENEHLRANVQRASDAMEAGRHESEKLKEEIANKQASMAVKELELKLALDAKQEAEQRADKVLQAITSAAETHAVKDATHQKRELEQELLQMQSKMVRLEREKEATSHVVAQRLPTNLLKPAASSAPGGDRTQRMIDESCRAASRGGPFSLAIRHTRVA